MSLLTRLATSTDYAAIEKLVLDAFEPITWQKKLDAKIGPLNGRDWKARWQARLRHIFQTQIILVGEMNVEIVAMSSSTLDRDAALAFIDVLGVAPGFQGQGLGRDMLRATIDHLKTLGCRYVNLDCLTDNDGGNALYQSEGFTEVARHIRWFKQV